MFQLNVVYYVCSYDNSVFVCKLGSVYYFEILSLKKPKLVVTKVSLKLNYK